MNYTVHVLYNREQADVVYLDISEVFVTGDHVYLLAGLFGSPRPFAWVARKLFDKPTELG